MSETRHERPGVYSVYDASSVTSAGRAAKRIGVAALAVKGTVNAVVTLTGYSTGVDVFGEDEAGAPGMSTLLKLLLANGASTVYAVRVAAEGDLAAYQAAFAALESYDVQVMVCGSDPAMPLNGAELYGIGGLQSVYSDNDIDLLVQGGVTPLEDVGGVVSPVRGITTRTKTGSAADATWWELTTILIADDVIPTVRSALRSKFARAKNTAQGRGAIRAQTIVELEKKKDAQIIESYGEVTVTASADDPTVCLVEFSFGVAHGLNQIHLAVHLTV